MRKMQIIIQKKKIFLEKRVYIYIYIYFFEKQTHTHGKGKWVPIQRHTITPLKSYSNF